MLSPSTVDLLFSKLIDFAQKKLCKVNIAPPNFNFKKKSLNRCRVLLQICADPFTKAEISQNSHLCWTCTANTRDGHLQPFDSRHSRPRGTTTGSGQTGGIPTLAITPLGHEGVVFQNFTSFHGRKLTYQNMTKKSVPKHVGSKMDESGSVF